MNDMEIAMQLTLKAIECGLVVKPMSNAEKNNEDAISKRNSFMSAEIAKFYNDILDKISNDFGVQA